jgi:hypothetical protein
VFDAKSRTSSRGRTPVTSRSATRALLPFVRFGGRVPGVHSGGGAKQVMADDSDYFTRRAIEENFTA